MEQCVLKKLRLTHFKNYQEQQFDLGAQINGFLGDNGMGKTNALDAIHFLCMGKSKFKLPDRQIMQRDARFFRLDGHFECADQQMLITAKIIPQKLKEITCNQVPYQKLSQHVGLLPMVFIAPDDTLMIKTGSEDRRRFMDHALCQEDLQYTTHLIAYTKLIKQRNALLKQQAHASNEQIIPLIEVYNQQLVKPAQFLYAKRHLFINAILPKVQYYYRVIAEGKEEISLSYQSTLSHTPMDASLAANFSKDRLLQRTTAGPHRDDLDILLDGFPAKKFASQGQLKSVLLALKLAEYDFLASTKQKKPLLILDDIFDKLDEHRVQKLLEHLLGNDFGQIFLSDTHLENLPNMIRQWTDDGNFFKINRGSANLL